MLQKLQALESRGVDVSAEHWVRMSEGGWVPRPWGVPPEKIAASAASYVVSGQIDFETERADKAALRESMETSHFSQSEARRAVEVLQGRAAVLQRELEDARKAAVQAETRSEEV